MHSVYILHSKKDGQLYIGYTTDVSKRVEAHNTGSVSSTKNRRPLQLIYWESFANKFDALRRERYFKTNEGKKMLKLMLRETFARIALEKEKTKLEIEIDRNRLEHCKDLAHELVESRGWTENDDDYWIQIKEETDRLWDEEMEREMSKHLDRSMFLPF